LDAVLSSLPTPVIYNVYGLGSGVLSFDDASKLVAAMRSKGIRQTGVDRSGAIRRELQGQPTFDKLAGPMYDGPKKVRYETWELNERLSV
jgi:hypothetical protein